MERIVGHRPCGLDGLIRLTIQVPRPAVRDRPRRVLGAAGKVDHMHIDRFANAKAATGDGRDLAGEIVRPVGPNGG